MIELNDILPLPLKEMPDGIRPDSQVFGTRLTFEKGRHYLIVAPSGRGKSTLVHLIYGLRQDFEGNLVLEGQPADRFDFERWSDWRQTKLAIIFQDIRLFHRLTAWENIQLKAQLYTPRAVSDQTLLEWMERLDILGLKDQPCETLSYGQRQRVGILRALCQPFDYLLMDEPFSHLDEDNARIGAEIIREVAENQGASRIMVSLGEDYGLPWDQVLRL
ncbi:MAG: ATP-binding cassette domain-containing protein [Bacteroidetes bacterium]|nr:MAG: ATP-binding cassette domain-containing protein [Bacteroidota bacterium]